MNERNVFKDYVHHELNQEITAIGGHYVFIEENMFSFHGRKVLYLIGHALFDTTCCGTGGCGYALVPGFIENWKYNTTEEGLPISRLEPIRDKTSKEEIQRLIKNKEVVNQVVFQ